MDKFLIIIKQPYVYCRFIIPICDHYYKEKVENESLSMCLPKARDSEQQLTQISDVSADI